MVRQLSKEENKGNHCQVRKEDDEQLLLSNKFQHFHNIFVPKGAVWVSRPSG